MRVTDSLKLLLGADEEELAAVLRQHREAVRARTGTGPCPSTVFRTDITGCGQMRGQAGVMVSMTLKMLRPLGPSVQ